MNKYEINFINKTNSIHKHLTYAGGYKNERSLVKLRCGKCGHVGIRNAQTTKQYRTGRTNYNCEGCGYVHLTTERTTECQVCGDIYKTRNVEGNICEPCIQVEEIRINKEEKQVKAMLREMKAKKNRIARDRKEARQRELARIDFETRVHTTECIHCKEAFDYIGYKETVCDKCLEENRLKAQRERQWTKDKRRRGRMKANGNYDRGIDLDSTIERYDNTCYICGEQCDKADHEWKSGVFYVGRNYPTMEHVIPISKGGTHTWDNVKLAHHYCNSIKSDTI